MKNKVIKLIKKVINQELKILMHRKMCLAWSHCLFHSYIPMNMDTYRNVNIGKRSWKFPYYDPVYHLIFFPTAYTTFMLKKIFFNQNPPDFQWNFGTWIFNKICNLKKSYLDLFIECQQAVFFPLSQILTSAL